MQDLLNTCNSESNIVNNFDLYKLQSFKKVPLNEGSYGGLSVEIKHCLKPVFTLQPNEQNMKPNATKFG